MSDTIWEWAILDIVRRNPGLTEDEIADLLVGPAGRMLHGEESLAEFVLEGCRGDDQSAALTLELMRYNGKHACPHCGATSLRRRNIEAPSWGASVWICRECWIDHNVRHGSVLYHTGTPPSRWCYAIWAALSTRDGLSRRQLARSLDVGEQAQARRMLERLRNARADDPVIAHVAAHFRFADGRSQAHRSKRAGWRQFSA